MPARPLARGASERTVANTLHLPRLPWAIARDLRRSKLAPMLLASGGHWQMADQAGHRTATGVIATKFKHAKVLHAIYTSPIPATAVGRTCPLALG